jgi:hypothetical protein
MSSPEISSFFLRHFPRSGDEGGSFVRPYTVILPTLQYANRRFILFFFVFVVTELYTGTDCSSRVLPVGIRQGGDVSVRVCTRPPLIIS